MAGTTKATHSSICVDRVDRGGSLKLMVSHSSWLSDLMSSKRSTSKNKGEKYRGRHLVSTSDFYKHEYTHEQALANTHIFVMYVLT